MNSFIARQIYLNVERLRGENVSSYLSEIEKTQWCSRDEIQTLQWNKMKGLLDHAYRNVPWYRNIFKERGLSPADIKSHEDLRLLPVLGKEDLRQSANDFTASSYSAKTSIIKSSGSTGVSVKFARDRKSTGYGRAAMYRGHRWHGVNIGDMEARLWGVPISFKDMVTHKVGDFLLNRFRERSFDLTEEVMDEFYTAMKRKRPAYLMGYPSLVYQYAVFLKSRGDVLPFAIRMVKVTSETLFDYQKEVIEEVFKCPVVNEYGAAEVGLVGFECPSSRMHLMSECVFVEEDNSGEGLSDDSRDLIITDLNNYAHPIIRYRLGDRGRLSSDSCVCGRGLPLIESIQGRTSDVVFRDDGSPVHSAVFSYILKEITKAGMGVSQYKVYQDSVGQLRIEIVKGDTYREDAEIFLNESVCKILGKGTVIEIDYVDMIKRERSGKLRYFQSNISRRQTNGA